MTKDLEILKKTLKLKPSELHDNYFCWIYPFTNENISGYYKEIDFTNKDVLTVTSSGDHILNAFLCGANNVDSFDINPLSKYYSELKIASIKTLSLEEFINFLYNKNKFKISKKYLDKDTYNLVRKKLKEKEQYFWDYIFKNYDNKFLYNSYLFTDDFLDIKSLTKANMYLTPYNYDILKEKLQDKSVNYHDCNIKNLINIKKEFDIILLSNIAAYLDMVYVSKIDYLKELKNIIDILKKDNSKVVVGYLYSRLLSIPGALGIYNRKEVRKYFENKEYKYLSFESSDILHYPKALKKILPIEDQVIITK